MKLQQLYPAGGDLPDIDITALAIDSRKVVPGALFAAFPGSRVDGAQFLSDALARGAAAILSGTDVLPVASVPHIRVANPRAAMAEIVARFYPAQPALLFAVTGTNGKSSVAEMSRQIHARLGCNAASIGTLGIRWGDDVADTGMTSPDVITFQETLQKLAQHKCHFAIFEASSHALDQYRVHGARIEVAGFTNLTRDHLDYHGTMENYGAAKARLFTEVLPVNGTAVINAADDFGVRLMGQVAATGRKVISYGTAHADMALIDRDIMPAGQKLQLRWQNNNHAIMLPLVGAFQAENALCAATMAMAGGAAPEKVFAALEKLAPVRGRLELAGITATGAALYVDYAHTPDGLEAALTALRPHTENNLLVVFGCGGDRDRGKRPQMGAIAVQLADQVIVTDDNPRTEDPVFIRSEIMAAASGASEIGDRRAAIAAAIRQAQKGDVILLAGKGHESGQIVGTTVLPFDDATVAREEMAKVQS